jgi:hypothetical protein
MSQPKWDEGGGCWTTTVKCPAFGSLDVLIQTLGENDPPSEQQLAALTLLSGLTKVIRKPIRKSVRRYAKELLGPEEYEELEPEDLQVDFHTALIPPQGTSAAYFFVQGSSDLDMEHDLACLCRNGNTFRVCHTDDMYAPDQGDATTRLEALLGPKAVKLEEG